MTGNKVAIDTNIAVLLLNGEPIVCRWILSFPKVFLPAAVLGELRCGAAKSGRPIENHVRIDALFAQCEFLPINEATCRAYADIRLILKQQGSPIPENDVWIAATCIDHSIPLATRDGHMSRVPSLQVLKPE